MYLAATDDSDDWIAEQILEQEQSGEWSVDMTLEEALVSLEKIGQSLR